MAKSTMLSSFLVACNSTVFYNSPVNGYGYSEKPQALSTTCFVCDAEIKSPRPYTSILSLSLSPSLSFHKLVPLSLPLPPMPIFVGLRLITSRKSPRQVVLSFGFSFPSATDLSLFHTPYL